MKNLKSILIIGGIAVAALLVLNFLPLGNNNINQQIFAEEKATVYYDPDCGCCGAHAAYLKQSGFEVEKIPTTEIEKIKKEHGIPEEMWACHTTLIGDYAVEGHMPVEAIEKLLQEKPELNGIALPGMPAGSPGMGGVKNQIWKIHGLMHNDETMDFLEI